MGQSSEVHPEFGFPQIRKTSSFVFWNRTRLYIMVLTLACLTFIQMNTLTFNFTVICMEDIVEDYNLLTNYTDTHWFERNTEKSLLFSGAAIGGLIGLIPAVPLISSLGLGNVQTISGIISAFGAFLFPLAVSIGFYTSLLCRILQGVGSAIMFTTVGVVPGVWAPSNEANTFMAILSCALQLSNIICMPVSGLLCESALGWRSIYYLFGGLTFIIYIVFWFTYSDDPKLHRNVSQKELGKISTGKIEKIKEPVPYLAICTDPTVLITWTSCFGGNMAFFALSLYGPTYLREILKFDVRETGFLSALPFILSAIVKFGAGQLSDRMTFLSEKARFVFFAATSQIGFAVGLVVMAFTSDRLIAQIAFNFAIVSSGLNIMGVIKCIQLRCRQHVHFAIAVISFTAYVVQFLAPIIVSIICPDNTPEQWTILFLFITGVIIVCNAGFPFITRSDPAAYTKQINVENVEK
ncbi:Major facilitator superfamily (MFS) profile domain-containing protein [Caenorhabditis elegans]|uniref:Major facilitator superfamily (MFS) profile domain-containing protein n=2 Tax=Caenorhabditis elegans TaxID=6239 RepID=A0A0M9JJ95_CAEEL|nr:Major facilitator superfamily (MFS) profile domain-containing protein [Caenorhabditis elegans]NP_001303757.1 Major facilitator superfamily (MFS) profile domain-containing protein [Caenorhabditis elegans]CUR30040.1 Major facilitator superfamily (MFS) profile domain-containing protein [Caenorhabditis elegans]CUR30056.1 Major facilitator superfamily (MFS) profile domain-containing protein [Caenorhabditis elegans]|eukprot:NP_001303741.1 Uncharacterized protein CELE_F56A4.12 [Caenorhabditis elegans]